MEKLPRTRLLEHHGGRHLLSEPHMRIQVLPVPFGDGGGALFASYHGEVLIQCIEGRCVVVTKTERCLLAEGDQVVLVEGEPFRVDRANGESGPEGVVQLVWAPGPNPCRACWESDSRFFSPGGG